MATRTEPASGRASERTAGTDGGAAGGWSDVVTVIRPPSGLPRLHLLELLRYRDPPSRTPWRDIKVRYKQTFLGIAWALLVPLFTSVVYVIVFGKFAEFPAGGPPLPAARPLGDAADAVLHLVADGLEHQPGAERQPRHEGLLPALLLPLAAVIVPIVDFLIGWTLMLGVMAWYGTWPDGRCSLPGLHGLAFVTALGVGVPALGRERALPRRAVRAPVLPAGLDVALSAWPTPSASSRRGASGCSRSTR